MRVGNLFMLDDKGDRCIFGNLESWYNLSCFLLGGFNIVLAWGLSKYKGIGIMLWDGGKMSVHGNPHVKEGKEQTEGICFSHVNIPS